MDTNKYIVIIVEPLVHIMFIYRSLLHMSFRVSHMIAPNVYGASLQYVG